ncbi:hypothetical protein [Paracoccus sp. SSK6]|uniref:hypothetical protein n=1 Tax=Paracoccus sp. SSK6 TaxID=3143131 RepID=UPI00321A2FDC
MVSIDEQLPLPDVRIEAGYAVIRIPLHEVHGYRVALAECPCRAPKANSTASIRQQLARALGYLQVR